MQGAFDAWLDNFIFSYSHAIFIYVLQDGLFDIVLVNHKLKDCFNSLEDILFSMFLDLVTVPRLALQLGLGIKETCGNNI